MIILIQSFPSSGLNVQLLSVPDLTVCAGALGGMIALFMFITRRKREAGTSEMIWYENGTLIRNKNLYLIE